MLLCIFSLYISIYIHTKSYIFIQFRWYGFVHFSDSICPQTHLYRKSALWTIRHVTAQTAVCFSPVRPFSGKNGPPLNDRLFTSLHVLHHDIINRKTEQVMQVQNRKKELRRSPFSLSLQRHVNVPLGHHQPPF